MKWLWPVPKWLPPLDRRWGVPTRALALFCLVLAAGGVWVTWRTIEDNRLYRRWGGQRSRSSDGLTGRVSSDWLPKPIGQWCEARRFVFFPQCRGTFYVDETADPELVKWISHLPGCSSISVSGDVIERSLAIVADAPWLSDLSLNGHSGKQQRPLVDLAPLRAAGRLRKFSINNAAIDRRSLESLSELRSLTSLHLQDVDLSADGAHGLAALRHLRKFSASFIALPTDSIARLAELPRECDVSLACHSPDDALLAQIAAIPQLRGLTLVGGAATDRGLAAFRGHRRLQTLSCDRIAGVTDAALESIAMLTELQRLNLSEVSITNAGIMRLSNASNLIGLRLRGTRVTQEAVDLLRTQRPGLSVDWWLF